MLPILKPQLCSTICTGNITESPELDCGMNYWRGSVIMALWSKYCACRSFDASDGIIFAGIMFTSYSLKTQEKSLLMSLAP